MNAFVKILGLLALSSAAHASAPSILLEACNLFDDRAKRLECLRAANSHSSGEQMPTRQVPAQVSTPNSLAGFDAASSPSRSRAPSRSSGGATCYTGPRGGTYTITASGRKNYSGC